MSQEKMIADLHDPSGRNQAKPEKVSSEGEKLSDQARATPSKRSTATPDREENDEALDIDSETGA